MSDYSTVLHALADPTRRAIVDHLRGRAAAVGEIAAALPVTRPAVSQHLRVLEEAELVAVRHVGTRRIYTLERRGIVALRRYVESFWSEVLEAFAVAAVGDAADEASVQPSNDDRAASPPTARQGEAPRKLPRHGRKKR